MAPHNSRAQPTNDELDMLEAMMDKMDGSRPSSSGGFPPRTTSRASSHSHLSHQSSNRSLHSLNSTHAAPGSSNDPRNVRSPSALSDVYSSRHDFDDDATPSVSQGEWGRTRTVSAQTYDDNSSIDRAHSPDVYRFSSAHYPSYSRSMPASPRSRSRPTPSPLPDTARSGSPLRLLPRSPVNNRTPLEDLTFFREVGALADERPWGSSSSQADADADSLSIRSGHSSVLSGGSSALRASNLRAARLREDIEKEAQRIKERASMEEMRRNAEAASAVAAGHRAITPDPPRTSPPVEPPASAPAPTFGARQSSDGRRDVQSGIPLFPGAPSPAPSPSIPQEDDTRSIRSVGSSAATGPWSSSHGREGKSHSGSASFSGSGMSGSASARTEYGLEGGAGGRDRERRTRQKESREWSQTCWVWQREVKPGSSGGISGSGSVGGFAAMGGKFSKAPLIRDVPAALKRKSNKRESAHHLLSPAEALLFNVEDSKSGGSKPSSSKEKDKSKEKGKDKAPAGPAAASRDGRWRRATGVLRDDGFFRVFADSDKTVVHSVHLPSLRRTDVHLVDHSLFGRPNCISIARPAVSPSTPRRASFLPSSASSTALSRSDDSVYLCFPSIIATQVWLVMAHCFAQPEFYLSSGAATPRPFRSSTARRGGPSGFAASSDSGSDSEPDGKADELESSCRIFRSLQVSINEGRALGELATEVVRPGPKASWERPSQDEPDLTTSSFDSSSLGPETSPAKSVSSMAMPRLHSRASHDSRGTGGDGSSSSSSEAFCEIEMGGEVVAQTALRKGTSPFWNETFVFSDLPPLVSPISIRVLQSSSKHATRPLLIGTATVRVPDLPRQQIVEDWWAVKPANPSKSSDAVGELSLSLKINEEVVLPSRDYQEILNLLTDDPEADLASEIAHEFPADLEEVTRILLRVYSAKSLLLPRVLRLADLEIDSNARNNRSAAILFRGNTILTKTIELYLRLIGAEYLDASIGNVIRRICADKVEIEIDPMKVKPGTKDKDLLANTHALHEWTLTLWNSIYDAREKCPHDLRQIFNHIQKVVVEKYGQSDDQKNTRWTCVSAFIFLRFFVPAVLNPKLFFIVSNPPDPKAQRTLTLVAKTLQGLANFSSFGQKEPWMLPMNAFVRENHAALVDFLEHVSTPGSSAVLRQEWTSPNAPAYLAPYRLRSSLSPLVQEGVPLLPHLVDLPRELGALAARVARLAAEKGPIVEESTAPYNDRCETPSIASSRGGRSRQFLDFADACLDIYSESRRRGGGLVSAAQYPDVRMKTPDPKMRAKRAMTGRPPTASSNVSTAGLRRSLGLAGTDRNARAESTGSEDLYIRKPTSQSVEPDVEAVSAGLARTHVRDVSVESNDSVMSRRNHRAFTINGAGAGGISGLLQGGAPKSFSTEDLSLLASLRSSSSDDIREGAASPSPLPTSVTLTSLSGYANQPSRPSYEGSQVYASRSIPAASILAPSEYAFPPNRSNKPSATPSAALSTSASTRTSSTSRSSQLASPVAAPTSRIRITQETTTTTSYAPDATTALSLVNGDSPVPVDDDFSLSPTSHEDGTPFESSFSGFSAPLMRMQTSQTSAHSVLTVLSGRSLTASSSSVSISAEVSAGAAGSSGGAAGLSGRRASTAGFSSFGLGGSGSRRGGPGDRGSGSISGVVRSDESEGGSSRASSTKGGLLSRAMGRKGSRAS
ncbi:hypothetical protein JCM10049v2_004176 [Rhodotorula toruloides]